MSRPVTIPDRRDDENPWVLVRKGKPLVRFPSLQGAQQFFNQLRRNAGQPAAAVFGPGGEAWYCAGSREGQWIRDDDRRERERQAAEADSGDAAA